MTRLLALAVSFALASGASAQDSCQVAVADLTVNDEPPPDQYRVMFGEALRARVEPVIQCYRERLAQRPGLAGTLRLRLWVSARQVIRVTSEESTLADPELETCAMARVHEVTLPPEAPEGGARVRFVLRFTTTTVAPPPVTPPPPPQTRVVAPEAAMTAPWTSGEAAGVAGAPPNFEVGVDRVRGAIGAATLGMNLAHLPFGPCSTGAGSVEVTMSIARTGAATARVSAGTITDRAIRRCVIAAIRSQPWGPQPGVTRATITVRYR